MTFDEYQKAAYRTKRPDQSHRDDLLNFALGLTGEAGEAGDYIKKVIFHGHEMDPEVLKKELGDVLWYVAGLATTVGLRLEDIAEGNIAKLKQRYPQGFSFEGSQNRVDVAEGGE